MVLQQHDFGDSPARCVDCGTLAVGPCARCRAPLCGDCCVLTAGGTKPYAICRRCEGRVGRSLKSAWWTVAWWLLAPILLLVALLLLLGWLFPGR